MAHAVNVSWAKFNWYRFGNVAVSGVARPTPPKKPSASPNANVILYAEVSIIPLSARQKSELRQREDGQVAVDYLSSLETNIMTMGQV